jgi:hypothetical protein
LPAIEISRLCLHRKRINISTVLAGQKLGITEVDEGIWLVSFMHYDLGYFDLEQKTLQPLDNPFGTRLSPMSQVRSVTHVSGLDKMGLARSERFELPTLGIEIRCSIQLSYERVRPADYQTWPGRASSGMSVAGMPAAVLADIGRRALAAEEGGGTVVIGEGARLRSGAVIVQVADRVGQAPVVQVVVVPIMAGVCQVWGQGRGGEQGGGNEKRRFGHFDSPEVPLKL